MITSKQLITLLLFTLLGINLVYQNHWLFGAMTIIALIIGIRQFVADKKELQSALLYVRIKFPLWRTIITLLLLATYFIFAPKENFLTQLIEGPAVIYLVIFIVIMQIADYYKNFIYSMRAFENGIKFPGRKSQLIEWRELIAINHTDTIVTILLSDKTKKFKIDPKDTNDLQEIINLFDLKH